MQLGAAYPTCRHLDQFERRVILEFGRNCLLELLRAELQDVVRRHQPRRDLHRLSGLELRQECLLELEFYQHVKSPSDCIQSRLARTPMRWNWCSPPCSSALA